MSVTNRSESRTVKASPLGNQHTIAASSFRNISISFRGKGFECPVGAVGVIPGDVCSDVAGEDALDLGDAVLPPKMGAGVTSGLGTG